jgi:hypothetical protein
VGRTPHKLCKVFLRSSSFLAGVFYRQPETMKIKSIFIMFHTISPKLILYLRC